MKCLQTKTVKKVLFCLIFLFFAFMSVSITHAETYNFVTKWGSHGSNNAQFSHPTGIAVDSSGNVYVADTGNNRIQKFDSSGTFLITWGSLGREDGRFEKPYGVAVDTSGNVYVAEGSGRIQKFDRNGGYITKWGSRGIGTGQFSEPWGIAVFNSSGNVYVADTGNNRIQKFDSNGKYLMQWGSPGSGDEQFSHPTGVAVDSSGNVYVADEGNSRIQKFDSNGNFITKWDSRGSGDGQFSHPTGIAVDSSGNVYVTDEGNARIQKFDISGNFITKWGSPSSDDGQFSHPKGVAVDSSGNVYVAVEGNSRIQKFALYADTTTSITPSANPSTSGQSVTLTAKVSTTSSGAGTPSGTVTFFDGDTRLGDGSLSSGQATFTTSSLSVGSHSIKAKYNGASNFNTSTSNILTFVIDPIDPNSLVVSISSEPDSVEPGNSSTVTVTVTGTDGKGVSGADVDLTTDLGNVDLLLRKTDSSGKSTATFTASDKEGKATIKAQVTKEGFNNASGETSVEVNLVPPITPNVSIFSEPESIEPGKSSTITVTVTGTDGKGISGANVTLEPKGKVNPATGETDSSGKFTSTFTSSDKGKATIKAQVTKEGFDSISRETSVDVKGSFPIVPLAAILLFALVGVVIYTKRPKPSPEPEPISPKLPAETALDVQIKPESIPADGESTAKVLIKIKDDKGNFIPSSNERTVELSITLGTVTSQVKIPSGAWEGTAVITSGEIAGTATIVASSSPLKEATAQVNFVSI